jgi:hypothetical protein
MFVVCSRGSMKLKCARIFMQEGTTKKTKECILCEHRVAMIKVC